MFIHKVASYIPSKVVSNLYFEELNGLTHDWIIERTGITERRQAGSDENTNTMAIEATKLLIQDLKFHQEEFDLIICGTYTPYDTIITAAHAVQNFLDIHEIPVFSVSSACSSLINCMEVVQGYFALNKARRALVLITEHNTLYRDEHDPKAGHLWGDGACALAVTKERHDKTDLKVLDIFTSGAANVGQALEGVNLSPSNGGLEMSMGKDVFINACIYMAKATEDILTRNNYTVSDLDYLIPHQANIRIIKNVANNLQLSQEQALSNIGKLGNTGSAGCGIVLGENWQRFKKNNLVVLTVFGGGYSYGSMLLRK